VSNEILKKCDNKILIIVDREWRGAKVAIKVNNTVTDVDGFLAEAKLTL